MGAEIDAARVNADYWLKAARNEPDRDTAVLKAEQAINAWKNCAVALDRAAPDTARLRAVEAIVEGQRAVFHRRSMGGDYPACMTCAEPWNAHASACVVGALIGALASPAATPAAPEPAGEAYERTVVEPAARLITEIERRQPGAQR